ncbi:MerR family transcriptional regulator [Sorangium sp. So ce216]
MWLNHITMYYAGNATKITGLSYRQLDNVVRNRLLQPSRGAAHGRGTVRGFSERDLIALRLVKELLDAGHRLSPFMHMIRYVQHGRGLPPLDQLDGKVLVSSGREVHVADGAKMNLSGTLQTCRMLHVVDLGAAAGHVRHRIQQVERKSK